jgi:hypothetical protein
MMPETVNLKESAEREGLQIVLGKGTSINLPTGKMRTSWYVEVSEQRYTQSGRLGKPVLLMRVIASEDQGPLDLLEMVKLAWQQGDVKIDRAA